MVTQNPGYENRLFDTFCVHTIDIVIDNWDEFLTTCQSETYSVCNVVIDGESSRNVGIRGKGNTSLSSVSAMGSNRYSFKLEFDHFSEGNSWYGLDKLSLNNLIQDNTMMKDFLCYRMMQEFDVNTPLCSYVFLTVNGEDWGLYLAVEGVEEAFLQRNYGTDHGALYKPDSMSFGCGPGNGQNFQMDDMLSRLNGSGDGQGLQLEELLDRILSRMEDAASSSPGQGGDGTPAGGIDFSEMFSGLTNGDFEGLGGLTGSTDVRLQYIDDNPSSYPNIFDNAKTDVTTADQQRLIASLRSLSAYENLENVLDLDTVLRYFVVNNFVVNDDSYTGTMVHNYYLYEKDGRLSMIPWDYNLSFGTFAGGSEGTEAVNDPIDEALSDRPMQAWIFSDEAYTERYHQLYKEFLDSVDISGLIEEAYTLITPYVQRDPTKFCSEEEFYYILYFLRGKSTLSIHVKDCQLGGGIASGVLAIGIPASLGSLLMSVSQIIVNANLPLRKRCPKRESCPLF